MSSAQKLRVVSAPRRPPPQKLVKDVQTLLSIMVYFELHTKKLCHAVDLYEYALRFYRNNVESFVNTDSDVQSSEGKHFLTPPKFQKFSREQLMRTTASVTSKTFSGKQIWIRGKDARKVVTNSIIPAYNSFLKAPGHIFPSGWEIDDMLQATIRKLYVESKSIINLATDVENEQSDGENDKSENEENENDKSVDSDCRPNAVTFPKGFPTDLQSLVMPDDWTPTHWNIFLWFAAPCELLYDRTTHPQLLLTAGNDPSSEEEGDKVAIKREGSLSLSRAAQKRKASHEAAIEKKSSEEEKVVKNVLRGQDREMDLAERVQRQDESDRILNLLKDCLADAETTPERDSCRKELKLYRQNIINEMKLSKLNF